MNANIRFEIIADTFCRMTGMLAPGKDAWAGPSHDERRQEFTRWNDEHKTIIFQMLNAVEHVMDLKKDDVVCPFCGETGYDLVGLKQHLTIGGLMHGACEKFVEISEG